MTNTDKNLKQAMKVIEMTKGDTTGWYAELYELQDEPVQELLDQLMQQQYDEEHGQDEVPKGRVHLTVGAKPVDASGSEFNQLPCPPEDEIEASKQKILAKLDGITAENAVAPQETGKVDLSTLRDAVKAEEPKPQPRSIKITIDAAGSTTFFEIPV